MTRHDDVLGANQRESSNGSDRRDDAGDQERALQPRREADLGDPVDGHCDAMRNVGQQRLGSACRDRLCGRSAADPGRCTSEQMCRVGGDLVLEHGTQDGDARRQAELRQV